MTQGASGWAAVLALVGRPFAISPERGAETVLYLASSPEVQGVSGQYFESKRAKRSSPRSYDTTVAHRLWQVSERLTQVAAADVADPSVAS